MDKGIYRVLHVVGKGLSAVSGLLFRSSDRAAPQRLADSLADDLRRNWAYLLDSRGGEVEPEARDRTSFDYAMSKVNFPELTVRVIRGRGEIRAQVARSGLHDSWEELSDILRATGSQADIPGPQDCLIALGNALQAHWDTILANLAGD
jgi:hypothetical protein